MTSSDLECKKWEDLDECKDDFVFPTDNGTLPDDEFFDKARGSDRLGAIGACHDCHAPAALRRLSRSHGLRRRSAEPTRSSTGWAFAQSSPSLPPSQLLASSPRAGWLTRQRGRRGRRYRSAWRGSSSSLPLAPSRPTACHVRASERLTARDDVQSGWRPGGRYTSPSCQPRPTLQPLRALQAAAILSTPGRISTWCPDQGWTALSVSGCAPLPPQPTAKRRLFSSSP